MAQLEAGDIVFTEAEVWKFSRRLISEVSERASTVHVAIASGETTFVYESVTAGLRRTYLSTQDNYTVYRNRLAQSGIGALIAAIAEGYVVEGVRSGGRYGKYSVPKLALAAVGGGGEREQWGARRTTKFYCSNYVARVLMAAKQTGAQVYTGTIDTHLKPLDLKKFLASDALWVPVM